MIILTRLNGTEFALNPDLIETMDENPDTTIRLVDKNFLIVRESMREVIQKIVDYRRACGDTAARLSTVFLAQKDKEKD